MSRLRDVYKSKVVSALKDKYGYKSSMAIPKVEKIVISMGVGKAIQDKKYMTNAISDITEISVQQQLG